MLPPALSAFSALMLPESLRHTDGVIAVNRDGNRGTHHAELEQAYERYLRIYSDIPRTLCHDDLLPFNVICAEKRAVIIDWEYAGMQDPHLDIAMFAVYAMYDREQVDALIDAYFPEGCKNEIRIKIYCYIAACGLLWSNWCEYKKSLGVEFGEYSLRQYRYAKEYYRIVKEELSQIKGAKNHE